MLALGVNHQSAPLALREQLAFSRDNTKQALQMLVAHEAANEAVILSTCNRVELYTAGSEPSQLIHWLADYHQVKPEVLEPHLYSFQGCEAVRHIMQVASGINSMILGEAEILGQLKQAYSLAKDAGSVGDYFQRLFPNVFAVTKQVRTDTAIGASPVSVATAAIKLSQRIFADLSKHSALLIGAGEMIDLVAMHLENQGVKRIIVANRTLEKSERIAKRFLHGHWIRIADVPVYLREVDIVITATASQLPILGKGSLETAMKIRKHRPMFIADLAVPRDVEPEVAQLADVYLYNIDDLKDLVDEGLKAREDASVMAKHLIDQQAAHFMRQLQAIDRVDTVKNYRDKIATLSEQVLTESTARLRRGEDPEVVLANFAHTLTNKIMHQPTVKLRQAAFDGRDDIIAFARRLFDL